MEITDFHAPRHMHVNLFIIYIALSRINSTIVLSEDTISIKASPLAVQVKVTVSIGHSLSTLTEYWALKSIKYCKET